MNKQSDLTITTADKGGKVVVIDKGTYLKNSEAHLNKKEIYRRNREEEKESEIENKLTKDMIREKKSHVIRKHLRKPRLPIFMDYQKSIRHLRNFHET